MIQTITITQSTVPKLLANLKDGIPIVMLYHMSTCPHCIIMRPSWNACKAIAKKHIQHGWLCIAEVEYSHIQCLPEFMQGIKGFPTIKLFKGDKALEYQGDRSENSILKFINDHVRKPASAPVRQSRPVTRKGHAVRKASSAPPAARVTKRKH